MQTADMLAADGKSKRILIVKTSSLGDLIHALPAVHCLKTGLAAAVDWVVNEEYADFAQCFLDVRRVIAFPRRRPGQWPAFLRTLRQEQYDLVVDLQGLLKSALIARMAHGRQRLGPSYCREGAQWFYDATAGARDLKRHAVEQNLDIVRYLGLPVAEIVFPLQLPEVKVPEQMPRVGFVPASRWPSKNWPAASFVEAGRELREKADAKIFVFGGAADVKACESIAREIGGGAVSLAGRLSLPELGAWLSAMQLVIANDSGPMHIAAALRVPVLAILGPTDPVRTGPYGDGHTVFKGRLLCQPCYRRRCRYEDASCMTSVAVEDVVAAAVEVLKRHVTITVR